MVATRYGKEPADASDKPRLMGDRRRNLRQSAGVLSVLLTLIGYLILKSTFLPRFLGVLLCYLNPRLSPHVPSGVTSLAPRPRRS